MKELPDWLLHIIWPNRCAFCGTLVGYRDRRCAFCEENAARPDPGVCLICGKAPCVCTHSFEWLAAPFYYEMGAEKAVRDLKFHNNRYNAKKLGLDMAECLRSTGLHQKAELVIPVPMYWKDERKRGYNQAAELGKWVAGSLGIPLEREALFKVRPTARQHELSAAQRAENLKNAYRLAAPERIAGKVLLLVDDVFTTGSTMESCAEVLKRGGARFVIALTAARTRKKELSSPAAFVDSSREDGV